MLIVGLNDSMLHDYYPIIHVVTSHIYDIIWVKDFSIEDY